MTVICPGCGEVHDLTSAMLVEEVVTCTWCAGVLLRLVHEGDAYVLREIPQASCPQCQTLLPLPDTVQPGDTFRHCQRTFVVSYAYGAYALEPYG